MGRGQLENEFWTAVPRRGKALFFAAVFFNFAPLIVLPLRVPDAPASSLLAPFLTSGLIATLYAMAFTLHLRYLVFALLLHASTIFFFGGRVAASVWPRAEGFSLPGFASMVCVALGYGLFVVFITTEGRRSVRQRTELALAKEIHGQLAPPVAIEAHGWQIVGRSTPSAEVGGDLIDVTAGPAAIDLYLGDVTGHGVRSGVVMAMALSALRTSRRSEREIANTMAEANEVLVELTEAKIFVTLAALRAAPDGSVTFASAGHPPLLVRPGRGGDVRELTPENPGLPLGVMPSQTFDMREVQCEPGDLLVAMTDGFTEVFDNEGRQLGTDGFARLVAEEGERPLGELLDVLFERVAASGSIDDDRSLLLLRRLG